MVLHNYSWLANRGKGAPVWVLQIAEGEEAAKGEAVIRYFLNSPALYNGRAAAAYLLTTKPKSFSGYVGPDGTVRLMVEIESRELRDAAERVRS